MFTKTSKSLVFLGALLVFSLLLASCQSMIASTEEMERYRAVEAWGANLTAQGERYLQESEQASIPWIELRSDVPPKTEVEELKQTSVPWVELRSDVPAPAMEQASVPWIELRSDVPPEAEGMVDAYAPGIGIRRTRLAANTYLIVYTLKSDRPAWVVFHADDFGSPGQILRYDFVESGTNKIARTEVLGDMRSEQVHVMLHEDLGTIGLFEFPGPDGPVYVDNEIVNELCFCPF